jgi:hypothetical protein
MNGFGEVEATRRRVAVKKNGGEMRIGGVENEFCSTIMTEKEAADTVMIVELSWYCEGRWNAPSH